MIFAQKQTRIRTMKSRFAFILSLLIVSMHAFAGGGSEFSADFVQSMPQQGEQQGRIFVGNNRMRMEFDANGSKMIQIVDTDQQTMYMINPDEKSYMRQSGQAAMMPGAVPQANDNPCVGMKNITCKRVGEEKVNGRLAEKWEFTSSGQAQSGKMTIWLDKKRRIPVRQVMPDGSGMELTFMGNETVSGRKTEKWQMETSRPGGDSQITHQWFDPELNINIREEGAGGFRREVRNIRTGKQPAELFSVPAGYEEISMPQFGGYR
jgi:outer membrane lipoprotein-sorting protein